MWELATVDSYGLSAESHSNATSQLACIRPYYAEFESGHDDKEVEKQF